MGMVGRLDVIGAWSDEEENLIQVIYEDSENGTVYISRTRGHPDSRVVSVNIEGGVKMLSSDEFAELRGTDG